MNRSQIMGLSAVLVLVALAWVLWQRLQPQDVPAGIARGNGRIEAVEIDLASRIGGRVAELRVDEGDFVSAGQVVAVIDRTSLDAQVRQAAAQLRQASSAVAVARSQLTQRQNETAAARAAIAQREAEANAAGAQRKRSDALGTKGFLSSQALDDVRARADSANAALAAARAQLAAVESAAASAAVAVDGALSAEAAAQANIERLQGDLDDTELKAPRDGRVQYVVAELGEVVAAGGKVMNLLDLADVHITFFLPTAVAGRVAIGAEVRVVLDAAPEYVIPAEVSFVAAEAQFTPRTVETQSEREKLMFRVKAQLPPALLRKHITQVKTGLPGVAWVRVDSDADWPPRLAVKLPP